MADANANPGDDQLKPKLPRPRTAAELIAREAIPRKPEGSDYTAAEVEAKLRD